MIVQPSLNAISSNALSLIFLYIILLTFYLITKILLQKILPNFNNVMQIQNKFHCYNWVHFSDYSIPINKT